MVLYYINAGKGDTGYNLGATFGFPLVAWNKEAMFLILSFVALKEIDNTLEGLGY